MNWDDVWRRLGRPDAVPDFDELLSALVSAALADKRVSDSNPTVFRVAIHPGVAEAGREAAGIAFQEAVDRELAATWWQGMRQGRVRHTAKIRRRAV